MEKIGTWERNSVISELTQGKELANELQKQLYASTDSRGDCGFLLEQIVSCYHNALGLLDCMALFGNGEQRKLGSPRSEVSEQGSKDQFSKDVHKKRKRLSKGSEEVLLCPGTGFEGQMEDGYNWRKYGQKDILGANHPRAYYRCTHRYTQGCLATKQVQRTDKDQSLFEVAYKGKHSCIQERVKQRKKNTYVQIREEESKRFSEQMMISIVPGLEDENQEVGPKQNFTSPSFPSTPIESENVENGVFSEPRNLIGTRYSPPFLSPATSESYFSLSSCQVNDFGIGHSFLSAESDFTEIVSNPTPVTNFPLGDLEFSIDQLELDPHFLDTSEFV